MAQALADYTAPLIVRVSQQSDITTIFKLRKVDIQRHSYRYDDSDDILYVRDKQRWRYHLLTDATLAELHMAPCV